MLEKLFIFQQMPQIIHSLNFVVKKLVNKMSQIFPTKLDFEEP